MRSIGLVSRKLSTEPVPNTTGSLSLSVHTPSPAFPATVMVLTCSVKAACFWMSVKE